MDIIVVQVYLKNKRFFYLKTSINDFINISYLSITKFIQYSGEISNIN